MEVSAKDARDTGREICGLLTSSKKLLATLEEKANQLVVVTEHSSAVDFISAANRRGRLVTIFSDGTVQIHRKGADEEVAEQFWETLGARRRELSKEVLQLSQEREVLRNQNRKLRAEKRRLTVTTQQQKRDLETEKRFIETD